MCQSESGSVVNGGAKKAVSSPARQEPADAKASASVDNATCKPAPLVRDAPRRPPQRSLRRRGQRDRQSAWSRHLAATSPDSAASHPTRIVKKKKKSKMASKHGDDAKSGGLDALLPSLAGVVVLVFVVLARMGFRGRATFVGIDLGTTNSVVCVQAPAGGVGAITCVPDPATGSPVVPSVVSFLDDHHARGFRLTKEERERHGPGASRAPHPVDVVVGQAAKDRINGHPHHTLYHAKRIIGREYSHESVRRLRGEVDFSIVAHGDGDAAAFRFPYHLPPSPVGDAVGNAADAALAAAPATATLTPVEVGAHVVRHLRDLARDHLGHENARAAVIAIPAKFAPAQRVATVRAFELAGLAVARVLEEPTAAALAYGLDKRDDVHYVMVYDFGGGTLDISLLYIGEGGYIEVLGSDGDEQLGGADFDAAVSHWLSEKKGGEEIVGVVMVSLARIEEVMGDNDSEVMDVEDLIEEMCPKLKEAPLCSISSFHTMGERLKIGLSDHPNEPESVAKETCFRLPPPSGQSVLNTVEELCEAIFLVEFSLTLHEYDLAVRHLYQRSILPIQRLLKDLNLQKEEIDEVVMVGGTTRMPQIRELVRTELGKERLNTHIDPDLTVAYGAASVID